jgi:hypothetical protein
MFRSTLWAPRTTHDDRRERSSATVSGERVLRPSHWSRALPTDVSAGEVAVIAIPTQEGDFGARGYSAREIFVNPTSMRRVAPLGLYI